MRILYSPQINNGNDTLDYVFDGDKITVTFNGEVDVFDFTGLSDGNAISYGRNPTIISTLTINPVIEATRENGALSVRLLKYITENAPDSDKFPDWVEV